MARRYETFALARFTSTCLPLDAVGLDLLRHDVPVVVIRRNSASTLSPGSSMLGFCHLQIRRGNAVQGVSSRLAVTAGAGRRPTAASCRFAIVP
jgi:hypothetical protein